jgi:hypothetical protein
MLTEELTGTTLQAVMRCMFATSLQKRLKPLVESDTGDTDAR